MSNLQSYPVMVMYIYTRYTMFGDVCIKTKMIFFKNKVIKVKLKFNSFLFLYTDNDKRLHQLSQAQQ